MYTDVEILRTWQENRPAGYWTTYDVPDNRALFGFPLANGWKAAGRLMADGAIADKYATNEVELWAPYWYTRGAWRCEDRAEWFFRIANPQPDPEGYARAIDEYLAKDYAHWGAVTIAGDPRMAIYRRSQEPFSVQTFALEQYAAAFDAAASPDLPLGYPVVEPPIGNPLDVNLGDLIRLEGFDLAYTSPLEPGETFTLTLYWRAQRSIDASYKVFNQSFYGEGTMVAQQDGFRLRYARHLAVGPRRTDRGHPRDYSASGCAAGTVSALHGPLHSRDWRTVECAGRGRKYRWRPHTPDGHSHRCGVDGDILARHPCRWDRLALARRREEQRIAG